MKTSRQFCFTHPSGHDIFLFRLTNSNGATALISNYGAIINSFSISDAGGKTNDIVLGFDKMEDYISNDYLANYPWMGCAIGRTANRIKNGLISIDGKGHQLSRNRGNDHLHGGMTGFDKKIWEVASLMDSPATLELRYTSYDGEEGYPGQLDVTIRFELTEEDELSYEYRAKTNQPTLVNLTHHSYFNLDNGVGTVDDHEVKIYSSQVLSQDDGLVVNGEVLPVKDTLFDFNEFKVVGKRQEKEIYDQSFVIDEKTKELTLVAEVISGKSGTHLQVYSTEPIVHFYSGRWFPEVKGKNGIDYGPCSGLCLETHIHPNAINIPNFPNTILRPGEQYYHKTRYKVTAL